MAGYPWHRENRENGPKIPCQGKHRELGNFAKTRGKHKEFCLPNYICQIIFPMKKNFANIILFAQVVNSTGKGYCDIFRENVFFF